MGAGFYIQKGGRWLRLDSCGRLQGERRRPRFFYLRRDKLKAVPTRRVLRHLATERCIGPPLHSIRRKRAVPQWRPVESPEPPPRPAQASASASPDQAPSTLALLSPTIRSPRRLNSKSKQPSPVPSKDINEQPRETRAILSRAGPSKAKENLKDTPADDSELLIRKPAVLSKPGPSQAKGNLQLSAKELSTDDSKSDDEQPRGKTAIRSKPKPSQPKGNLQQSVKKISTDDSESDDEQPSQKPAVRSKPGTSRAKRNLQRSAKKISTDDSESDDAEPALSKPRPSRARQNQSQAAKNTPTDDAEVKDKRGRLKSPSLSETRRTRSAKPPLDGTEISHKRTKREFPILSKPKQTRSKEIASEKNASTKPDKPVSRESSVSISWTDVIKPNKLAICKENDSAVTRTKLPRSSKKNVLEKNVSTKLDKPVSRESSVSISWTDVIKPNKLALSKENDSAVTRTKLPRSPKKTVSQKLDKPVSGDSSFSSSSSDESVIKSTKLATQSEKTRTKLPRSSKQNVSEKNANKRVRRKLSTSSSSDRSAILPTKQATPSKKKVSEKNATKPSPEKNPTKLAIPSENVPEKNAKKPVNRKLSSSDESVIIPTKLPRPSSFRADEIVRIPSKTMPKISLLTREWDDSSEDDFVGAMGKPTRRSVRLRKSTSEESLDLLNNFPAAKSPTRGVKPPGKSTQERTPSERKRPHRGKKLEETDSESETASEVVAAKRTASLSSWEDGQPTGTSSPSLKARVRLQRLHCIKEGSIAGQRVRIRTVTERSSRESSGSGSNKENNARKRDGTSSDTESERDGGGRAANVAADGARRGRGAPRGVTKPVPIRPRPVNFPPRHPRAFTPMEDRAIVDHIQREGLAKTVNGNTLWRNLETEWTRLCGVRRTWHSLRNRYLRYLLPSLHQLALSPREASHLRAAAATGSLKLSRKRRNSLLGDGGGPLGGGGPKGPQGAWARRPRPALDTTPPQSDPELQPIVTRSGGRKGLLPLSYL